MAKLTEQQQNEMAGYQHHLRHSLVGDSSGRQALRGDNQQLIFNWRKPLKQ